MAVQTRKSSFLGFLAGAFSFFRRSRKLTTSDLKNADFKSSTQSMGVRFAERIREVFRFKWIRRTPDYRKDT